MKKYAIHEKLILIIGLVAIITSFYLKDYFIIPLVLISYILFWIWDKFVDKKS